MSVSSNFDIYSEYLSTLDVDYFKYLARPDRN